MKASVKVVLRPLGLLPLATRLYRAGLALDYSRKARRLQNAAGGLPLPPGRLAYLSTGVVSPEWYVESGRRGAACLREALAKQGASLESCRALLDFGCGAGRIIRYWRDLPGAIH